MLSKPIAIRCGRFRLAAVIAALGLFLSAPVIAESSARDATCDAKISNAWSSVTDADSAYSHSRLGYFNKFFKLLNAAFPSGVEAVFCHLRNSLAVVPDVDSLPQTVTRTWESQTLVLALISPTAEFATNAGYAVDASLSVNSSELMRFYWGGGETDSKGFLITGAGGITGGNTPMYLRWDRSGNSQTLSVLGAEYQTSLLGNAAASSGARGDRVAYGRLTYDKSSAGFSVQVVVIEEQHSGGTPGTFGCFKLAASGTKGGSINLAYTQDSLSGTGHALSSTAKDSTELAGILITDSTSTTAGCESSPSSTCRPLTGGELSAIAVFDKSCQDLANSGSSGGAFSTSGTGSNLAASPADIF